MTAAAHQATVQPRPAITGHVQAVTRVAPLSTSDCVAQIGIHCYSPLQYRLAYNLNPLYAKGVTGAHIVLVKTPVAETDLSSGWGTIDAATFVPALAHI